MKKFALLSIFIFLYGCSKEEKQNEPIWKTESIATPLTDKLELVDWSFRTTENYAYVQGLVKNISSESLPLVEAEVVYKDKSGGFVTTDETYIKYHPILPGQTSPFEIMTTYNPEMSTANVSFKMDGVKISTKYPEPKPEKSKKKKH